MLNLAPKWRYNAERILTSGTVTLVFALVLNLYADIPFHPAHLVWFLLGVLMGIIEQTFFRGRVSRMPVYAQFLLRVAIISMIASAILSLLALFHWMPTPVNGPHIGHLRDLWSDPRMVGIVVNALIICGGALLFMEMEQMVGARTFRRFLTGRYVHPKRERIIVMFMDLTDSTAWTEKLGDERYYAMLNETFERMTVPVLRSDAEILKYIGDEVIFTWSVPRGSRAARCLDLYFDIHEAIDRDAAYYRRTYGMVPRFRAGIHCGEVITSQVGTIKRTIDHSGDAMNTCARMVGAAKALHTGMVASEDLLAAMPPSGRFTFGPSSAVELRGKALSIAVRSVSRQPAHG